MVVLHCICSSDSVGILVLLQSCDSVVSCASMALVLHVVLLLCFLLCWHCHCCADNAAIVLALQSLCWCCHCCTGVAIVVLVLPLLCWCYCHCAGFAVVAVALPVIIILTLQLLSRVVYCASIMLALCIVPALSVVLVLMLHFMLYFVLHGRAALCCLVCSGIEY